MGNFVRASTFVACPLKLAGTMVGRRKSMSAAPVDTFELDIVVCKRRKSSFVPATCAERPESKTIILIAILATTRSRTVTTSYITLTNHPGAVPLPCHMASHSTRRVGV